MQSQQLGNWEEDMLIHAAIKGGVSSIRDQSVSEVCKNTKMIDCKSFKEKSKQLILPHLTAKRGNEFLPSPWEDGVCLGSEMGNHLKLEISCLSGKGFKSINLVRKSSTLFPFPWLLNSGKDISLTLEIIFVVVVWKLIVTKENSYIY